MMCLGILSGYAYYCIFQTRKQNNDIFIIFKVKQINNEFILVDVHLKKFNIFKYYTAA